ncbi:MAG: peptidase MA family metallohydrolase, partial [Dehalococcoidales bacterium]|nr:peptidase MA family metallohydrolase [Dehalococcoidales bacterium]
DMEFPAKIHFSLSARSDADITDVRLYYTVERESFAQVTSEVYIEFVPGTVVDADWTWDMKKTGGLPTGASVKYWWKVKDVNGDKAETTPASIRFDDKRYIWRSLTENNVTMYWYKGNQSFAGELMSAAQQALTRLSKDTGAHLKTPVKIYIYANSQDLQGAMIFPQEWTGGSAFTEFGIITIGIDTNNLDWGKLALAHELTHLVVHQMTFNPYIDLPTWLDEGLAMYNEGVLGASFVGTLQRALSANSLISVRSLASPFSANTNEALLAYAQSYSLIEFLVTNYGQSNMLGLLSAFKEGSSYDNALARVYDFDMDGLDTLWRNYVKKQYQQTGFSAPTSLPAGSLNCLYDRIISSASPV